MRYALSIGTKVDELSKITNNGLTRSGIAVPTYMATVGAKVPKG